MAAEDVIQEVLVKVWQKKDELEHVENKEAWCMTVTRNLSLDKLRKKKYKHESVEEHYGIADGGMTPYEAANSNDVMQSIRKAMNELPEEQHRIVHLRDVEGYKYKEIAEITGHTVDQVKVYLHRARTTLRKKLANIER